MQQKILTIAYIWLEFSHQFKHMRIKKFEQDGKF